MKMEKIYTQESENTKLRNYGFVMNTSEKLYNSEREIDRQILYYIYTKFQHIENKANFIFRIFQE